MSSSVTTDDAPTSSMIPSHNCWPPDLHHWRTVPEIDGQLHHGRAL
jgi:hypothetical protein